MKIGDDYHSGWYPWLGVGTHNDSGNHNGVVGQYSEADIPPDEGTQHASCRSTMGLVRQSIEVCSPCYHGRPPETPVANSLLKICRGSVRSPDAVTGAPMVGVELHDTLLPGAVEVVDADDNESSALEPDYTIGFAAMQLSD